MFFSLEKATCFNILQIQILLSEYLQELTAVNDFRYVQICVKTYITHRYLCLDWSGDEAAQRRRAGGTWFWVAIRKQARVLPAPSTDKSTVIFRSRRNMKTWKNCGRKQGNLAGNVFLPDVCSPFTCLLITVLFKSIGRGRSEFTVSALFAFWSKNQDENLWQET